MGDGNFAIVKMCQHRDTGHQYAMKVIDKAKLKGSFGWDFDARAKEASFVDIAEMAKKQGVPYGLHAMSTHFKVPMLKSKLVGRSNWANKGALSSHQREYAADDAFSHTHQRGLVALRHKHWALTSHNIIPVLLVCAAERSCIHGALEHWAIMIR